MTDDIDGDGNPETRTLRYRSPLALNGSVNPASKNFGDGNGLLLSVVISGDEAVDQLRGHGVFSPPKVSRLIEIEENKVLVFYASGTLNFVELLELREETGTRDFDLDPPLRPSELLEVKLLRGEYKLFPGPFLPYDAIAQITGSLTLVLDVFQPILIPDADSSNPNEPPFPGERAGLRQTSSTFLKVGCSRNREHRSAIVRGHGDSTRPTTQRPGVDLQPAGCAAACSRPTKQILIFERRATSSPTTTRIRARASACS